MLTDPKKTKDEIVQWIRDYFAENGPECSAVVGISGGKDSTIVAALCVEALGKDRVFGVMMPNGIQADIKDSIQVVKALGISSVTVNISGAYSKLMAAVGSGLEDGVSEQTKVNLPPRLRMATLYAVAQSLPSGGRVANTCNMSEDYVGYSTKFDPETGNINRGVWLAAEQFMVVELGGSIQVDSDKGAQFRVYVPIARVQKGEKP